MTRKVLPRNSDLRGAVRLAADATVGITDLVEAVHERIARPPGLRAHESAERARGISGFVYKTVRSVTRAVGGSVDGLLRLLEPALNQDDATPRREAIVAALNGVMGDHLAASANPLATPMALHRDGRPLVVEATALGAGLPHAGGSLLVLVHGLCMNDLQWSRNGHDHGAALARDLGFTPLYLRYNSGLHISTNGQALAEQLEHLLARWPRPVDRLVLLGHSMGGLVARSAVHQAKQAKLHWPSRLSELVFLGSPHHGAPLERGGHWVDIVLGATPYAAPFARLGQVRSAGITDLRHGMLLDADWKGRGRFVRSEERPHPVPLPRAVRCYAIAASLGRKHGGLKSHILGDGLVPLDSALGRDADPHRRLVFAKERQWISHSTNHLELLSSPKVYAQLLQWLSSAS